MTKKFEIREFEYYLIFMDDHGNYVNAYGYQQPPAIIDMKYAIETLSKEEDLIAAIPNFHNIIDYICFEVMTHKKFIKYMVKQEKKMSKLKD
jgi:hypothetical protein